MRVANLDMTDPEQNCPGGFRLVPRTEPQLRTCGRPGPGGCVSTIFPTYGKEYSRVCGRVIGYQDKTPDAFHAYQAGTATTIDSYYVAGVSITHGFSPQQHISTFVAAIDEYSETTARYHCPCTRPGFTDSVIVPSFVGKIISVKLEL